MTEKYKGYRMPKSIIGYAVRQYHRYKLILRDVSEMLLERGVEVTYETIRKWCKVWGPVLSHLLWSGVRAFKMFFKKGCLNANNLSTIAAQF
jgi:transposase-like protein